MGQSVSPGMVHGAVEKSLFHDKWVEGLKNKEAIGIHEEQK